MKQRSLELRDEFVNSTAVVTGSGRGIGEAVALRLAANGAKVLVADLDIEAAQAVAGKIVAAGGEALACRVDVQDPESVQQMVEASRELGPLKYAVNNAGVGSPTMAITEYPADVWNRVIQTNLTGVFHCLQSELNEFQAGGPGAIVNVASVLGTVGRRYSGAYVAAKHGVVGLTKTAALEVGDQGIRVNAVCPGYVITDLNRDRLTEEIQSGISADTALGRLGEISEIADTVTFLLSDEARYMTGACLVADGGFSAH